MGSLKGLAPKVYRYLGWVLTVVSIAYLCRAILRLDLKTVHLSRPFLSSGIIVSFSILYAFIFSLFSLGWLLLLRHFGSIRSKDMSWGIVLPFYNKANLMKYLPGNVMEFVGRNVFGKKFGLQHIHMVFASAIETVISLIAGAVLALFFAFEKSKEWIDPSTIFQILTLSFVFVLSAALIFLFFSRERKSHLKFLQSFFSYRFFVCFSKCLGLQLFVFVSLGVLLFLIFTIVLDMSLGQKDFLAVLSAFALSWTVGFVTPGAPGGVGVREAVMISCLAGKFGMEATVLASMMHRFISIFGDLIAHLIGLFIDKVRVQSQSTSQNDLVRGGTL